MIAGATLYISSLNLINKKGCIAHMKRKERGKDNDLKSATTLEEISHVHSLLWEESVRMKCWPEDTR